jgi:ERCC4-type nuclease
MELICDDREDKKRIEAIKGYFHSDVIVRRLPAGDILVSQDSKPDILIEVKTIQDFIGSCRSRQIQKEALQMKDYPFRFILIYDDGNWNKKYCKPLTLNEWYGNIVSLQVRYKVNVIQCDNTNHFLKCIKSIISNVNKSDEPIEPPIVRTKDSNEMINVLIGLPAVGKKMARTLLDTFRTPGQVFQASDSQLDDVPRLQNKSKEAIRRMR